MNSRAAEEVRKALKDLRAKDAGEILSRELPKDPANPDLICEQGHHFLFTQQEAHALRLLPKAVGGERYGELEQSLANHFHCVRQAGGKLTAEQSALINRVGVDTALVGIRLTACLIVKDEEKHLRNCLESIQSIVDEIVVVDTGSTDLTVKIAEEFGAKIGTFEWCNDFSAARNASLALATGHWILWIDADEEVTRSSVNLIREAVIRPQFGGYAIEIVNFVDDREQGNTFVHSPVRLFRNLPGVRFTGCVHEQVFPSIEAHGLPWARLENAKLLHWGYRPSEVEAKGKHERTLTLLQSALDQNPEDSFQWFNLANAYTISREYERAIPAAREAIRLMTKHDHSNAQLTYQLLALSLSATGKMTESLAACDEADAAGFGGMLIEFERAQTLLKIGDHAGALEAIDRSFAAEWKPGQSGDRGIETHKRHIVRGQILACLGRQDEALEMFDQALSVDPGYSPAQYSKGATLERLGRLEEALDSFRKAGEDQTIRHLTLKAEARCAAALDDLETASRCFRESWHLNPNDTEAWVGWCAACADLGDGPSLLEAYDEHARIAEPSVAVLINWGRALAANGHSDRALQMFSEAIRREPENPNAYFNCGDLLFRLGKMYDAAHLYESGLKLDPGNADAWFTLGNSLAHLGLTEGAVISYRETLRLRPGHMPAQHNLEQVAA